MGLIGHLERLGAPLAHPVSAGARLAGDERARVLSIVGWLVLLAIAANPESAGAAMRVARVDPYGGLLLLGNGIARRLAPPLVAALVGGLLIHVAGLKRGGPPFDRAVDVAAFALAPYLLLGAIGASLSSLGVEAWALPHRTMSGPTGVLAARVAVGLGPTAVLIGLWIWRMVREGEGSAASAPPGVKDPGGGSMDPG